ncbi:MAG: 2-(5''-triphosphoribosyl)-3'-dephosphocoenzyme-A synthase [Candidatus Heimdallarchaeota archaeon LC_2]|nr:MAG: 2-(5''-triphosphoribosyl)-3'-dephosphocoenzyme-A synthase [Candidatus Heimdallarchaeota archaeon LC_2]
MLSVKGISNHIALNAILAGATQVASPVKPGNVHRYHDFKLTKMEHYLSSAVALNNPMFELATRGVLTERELIDIDEVDMGWIIAEAAKDNVKWHNGGITNLGMLFLFSPIALAAGYLISENDSDFDDINLNKLPTIATKFLENTTPEDTVNIFSMLYHLKSETYPMSRSIGISLPESISQLLENEINLLDFYSQYKKKNLLFQELCNNYKLIFTYGLNAFNEAINEKASMVNAITHTYITLLSLNLDSIIFRKHGRDKAFKVMQQAKNIMENGGFLTSRGRILTYEMDKSLHNKVETINPGVTADLTATVTFISTLSGIRP